MEIVSASRSVQTGKRGAGSISCTVAAGATAGAIATLACSYVRAESRTPTVAAAYLVPPLGVSGREAFERIRTELPNAHPDH